MRPAAHSVLSNPHRIEGKLDPNQQTNPRCKIKTRNGLPGHWESRSRIIHMNPYAIAVLVAIRIIIDEHQYILDSRTCLSCADLKAQAALLQRRDQNLLCPKPDQPWIA